MYLIYMQTSRPTWFYEANTFNQTYIEYMYNHVLSYFEILQVYNGGYELSIAIHSDDTTWDFL